MNANPGLSLVADVGGTNTRVALAVGQAVRPQSIRRFRNADFDGIDAVLARYMADEQPGAIAGACVAAAGPVQDGTVEMTNLRDPNGAPWIIDNARVSKATQAPRIAILNDLQAQGQALGFIAPEHLRLVMKGPTLPGASMLVVGLGTGVNAAPVHGTGTGRIVPPSECGHVTMPVRSAADLALMQFIEQLLAGRGETPHCGVEEVLSGRGLENLHAFASDQAGLPGGLKSAAILAALEAGDPVATRTAAAYIRILALVLADQALIHLPLGGIYLIGGMARAMTPYFDRFGLTETFREARRVDLLTKDFAIRVVEDDYAALTGCAAVLAQD